MLLLSWHAPLNQISAGAFQEMRQSDLADPLRKASWTATSRDGLGEDIALAIRIATSGRPDPVHLSLPDDLLEALDEQATIPSGDAFLPAGPSAAICCSPVTARSQRHSVALASMSRPEALQSALEETLASGQPACINAPMDNIAAPVIRRC